MHRLQVVGVWLQDAQGTLAPFCSAGWRPAELPGAAPVDSTPADMLLTICVPCSILLSMPAVHTPCLAQLPQTLSVCACPVPCGESQRREPEH